MILRSVTHSENCLRFVRGRNSVLERRLIDEIFVTIKYWLLDKSRLESLGRRPLIILVSEERFGGS